MTKKDLFDGLNYIDDQIIEEAQPTGESAGYSDEIYVKNHETHHGGKEDKNRKKHKKFARAAKALATVAAVLVVAVLGTEVVRLNNRIDELETCWRVRMQQALCLMHRLQISRSRQLVQSIQPPT